jgi:putative solute:sodium symporter small subunit
MRGMSSPKPPTAAVRYWRKNLIILTCLLLVWFVVSFPLAIVFAAQLNEFKLGGFPLGFWIAQQGSILVYVLLVLIYALAMRWLDRHYDVHED